MGTLKHIKTFAVLGLLLFMGVHLVPSRDKILSSVIITQNMNRTVNGLLNIGDMNVYPQEYAFAIFYHFKDFIEASGFNSINVTRLFVFLQDLDLSPRQFQNIWGTQERPYLIQAWQAYRANVAERGRPPIAANQVIHVHNLWPLFREDHLLGDNHNPANRVLTYGVVMNELKLYINSYNITNRGRKREFWIRTKIAQVRALKVKALLGFTIFVDFHRRVQEITQGGREQVVPGVLDPDVQSLIDQGGNPNSVDVDDLKVGNGSSDTDWNNLEVFDPRNEPDEPEEEDHEWQLDPNFDINANLTDEGVRQMLDFFGEEQPPSPPLAADVQHPSKQEREQVGPKEKKKDILAEAVEESNLNLDLYDPVDPVGTQQQQEEQPPPATEQPGRKRPHEDQAGPDVGHQSTRGVKKPKHRSVDQDQESKSAGRWLVAEAVISATLLLVSLVGLGLFAWFLQRDGNGNSQGNTESSDGSNA